MTTEPSGLENRFRNNLARVRGLVDFYENSAGAVAGRPSVQESDILRAAVVLLHATLEDFLRSLALVRLPRAGAELLKQIPFAGGDGRRATLTLGDLCAYRGRFVDEVISDSIEAYLKRSSYNNPDDIARLLVESGLEPSLVARHAPRLASLMSRRHHIAHRVDRNESTGRGHHAARSIGRSLVLDWIEAVDGVVTDILGALRAEGGGA